MRIPIVDIAKCLLIMLVYWFHIPRIYLGWLHGTNSVLMTIDSINSLLFTSFFIVAFFILSGYFLNTQRSLLEVTRRDALTLLLPALTLSVVTNVFYSIYSGAWEWRFILYTKPNYWFDTLGFWFLSALFISKLIAQLLIRYVKKVPVIILVTFCLCALGLMLRNGLLHSINFFHYHEAFMLCPMTIVGYYCKQNNFEPSRSNCTYLSIGYVLTILLLWTSKCPIYGFNYDASFSPDYIPMAFWLGISGTAFILYLSSWLIKSTFLQKIGQMTLPLFCFNFFFVDFFLSFFMPIMDRGYVFAYIAIVFICAITSGVLVSFLFNSKYLRWTLGKFERSK